MAGKFVVTQDDSGEYRFALTTHGGDVIVSSIGYATKGSALNAVDGVRSTAADAVLDDRTPSQDPVLTD
ncbi:hypothetical protein EDF38_2133 [Frigoribacterium sp. PhB160]|uniref:YegP family protein n=1 Tax=Frigoribacterium sp. PhB160 TaxID=2485192 RepID=UPI000F49C317|nr:DUF1508 domain-containing protein [Frigoribacterium sp. PhB160]ROS59288.1 hypothetical protein EDF38_2133 [Frigoribacterium sp. PhB160]